MSATLDSFTHEARIAYFSMEIALRSDIPTYSGGLNVLAGDTMRSAADPDLPIASRRAKRIEHSQYILQHGEDMPEIRNWTWAR